ncbi:hypothetical protein [Nonomuraea sp. NPDC049709]|uniref:hypothetical protein n=1 Tax=Nonomuraea sp. NPDC049709 TaxID=3154736 RepID=UPI003445523A
MGSMRVNHLNCGTMHPASRRLTNGTGGLFAAATLALLRELHASHPPRLEVFCAHDPVELARYDQNPTEDLSCP